MTNNDEVAKSPSRAFLLDGKRKLRLSLSLQINHLLAQVVDLRGPPGRRCRLFAKSSNNKGKKTGIAESIRAESYGIRVKGDHG